VSAVSRSVLIRARPGATWCDLTVRRVVRALGGLDAYLVVANSHGVNVWCPVCVLSAVEATTGQGHFSNPAVQAADPFGG
jgi:hypothetical protein